MKSNKRVSLLGLLAGGALIPYLIGCGARLEAQTRGCPCSSVHGAATPILDAPVRDFKVEHANMAEALLKLRVSDVHHVVIGFERIPHPEGEKGGPISLEVSDGTLGGVVQRLCRADPRYECEVIGGLMIEVRPKGAAKDPKDLLNMKVQNYRIDANVTADQAIEQIAEDAPELREFLYHKVEEWVKKTGEHPAVFGNSMSGNIPPPRFTLELHNVTVRQILDAISLKGIEMFKEGPDFDSRGMPIKFAPVGWEYDFVIHPNAATGLDGFPKWTRF